MNQILRMEQTKQIKNRLGLFLLFLFWFVKGTFNSQPIRWVVVTLTISLGISLAVAINIVNKSAITEFNHSTNLLRGDASYQIKAKTGFFNELIFEEFLDLKNKFGVSEVSPVLELSLITKDKQKLTIFGLDFFKVAKTNPIFLALPEQNKKISYLFLVNLLFFYLPSPGKNLIFQLVILCLFCLQEMKFFLQLLEVFLTRLMAIWVL